MNTIIDFFNHPFFILVGGFTTLMLIIGLVYKLFSWFFGITPIVFRLGIALWRREIAIFSDDETYNSLKELIVDSNIFKEKNIINIRANNIDKAKGKTLFLVDWETFQDNIESVFSIRNNEQTAVIIYAKPASIPHDKMNDIANRSNTVVVNFRGRLLNDILTSLITTSYDK